MTSQSFLRQRNGAHPHPQLSITRVSMAARSNSSVNSRLSVDENASPTPRRPLSRSPHPYHRQNGQLQHSSLDPRQGPTPRKPVETANSFQGRNQYYNTGYFDSDSRKRRKISTSPSESGTEADDERPVLLKGLPAPPLRPRKGWKPAGGLETGSRSSPLLTPSALDDGRDNPMAGDTTGFRGPPRSPAEVDASAEQKKDKNFKRRQAEVVRRVLEAMSLAVVGYLGASASPVDLLSGKVEVQTLSQWSPAEVYRNKLSHACCGRSLRCVRSPQALALAPAPKSLLRCVDLQSISNTRVLRSCASSIPCLSAPSRSHFPGIGESGICTSKHRSWHMLSTC